VGRQSGTRRYGVPADAISVPADSAAAVVKFTISIPRKSFTNAKTKYSSGVVPPDPSVHFYHCGTRLGRPMEPSVHYKQKDRTATYIAVKYMAYNEVHVTLGINSKDNMIA